MSTAPPQIAFCGSITTPAYATTSTGTTTGYGRSDCIIVRLTQKDAAITSIEPMAPEDRAPGPVVGPSADHRFERGPPGSVSGPGRLPRQSDKHRRGWWRTCRFASVTQRWVGCYGATAQRKAAVVTVRTELRKVPKFEPATCWLLKTCRTTASCLRRRYRLAQPVPDRFLPLQHRLDFVIAQPVRRAPYIDLPIAEQQRGCSARQTRAVVEIGPVVSFHRSVRPAFLFDMTSPMGWGYENVLVLSTCPAELKMGSSTPCRWITASANR